MSEAITLFPVHDLSGGLNVRSEDHMIENNQGSVIENFQFNLDGSLTKRNGSAKYNASGISSNSVHSLYRYYKSASAYGKMLAVCASTLYEGDDGAGTWTSKGALTASDPCSFETWKDVCYIANGTVFKTWDGTTLADVAGSPAIPKYVVFRQDRLYTAGVTATPNRLFYCDTGDPATWTVGTNYIDIFADDGDVITGILPLASYLVIYKHNSIWLLSGNSAATHTIQRFSASIGCDAPKSLTSLGGIHYFLDKTGVYGFNGTETVNVGGIETTNVSENVQAELDTIPSGQMNNSFATIYKRQYLLAYTSAGQTANDRILVLDLRLGSWTLFKGWDVACFANWDGRIDANELYGGGSAATGFVWKLDTGSDDGGSDIAVKFTSKAFNLDNNPWTYKQVKLVHLATDLQQVSPTMILSFDWDEVIQAIGFVDKSDTSLWDVAKWDEDDWVGGGVQKMTMATRWSSTGNEQARGQNVSVTITESSSVQWKLLGFALSFTPEPTEYRILH